MVATVKLADGKTANNKSTINGMARARNLPVREERTNWRDEHLSERHRQYGFECPAMDIDFLMVEFNHFMPLAIVDYKAGLNRAPLDVNHPAIKVMKNLAEGYRDGLPFFLAFYDSKTWEYCIYPYNEKALKWFTWAQRLSESEYVGILYTMRNIEMPASVSAVLNDKTADEA